MELHTIRWLGKCIPVLAVSSFSSHCLFRNALCKDDRQRFQSTEGLQHNDIASAEGTTGQDASIIIDK